MFIFDLVTHQAYVSVLEDAQRSRKRRCLRGSGLQQAKPPPPLYASGGPHAEAAQGVHSHGIHSPQLAPAAHACTPPFQQPEGTVGGGGGGAGIKNANKQTKIGKKIRNRLELMGRWCLLGMEYKLCKSQE